MTQRAPNVTRTEKPRRGANFAVFILFFGVGTLEDIVHREEVIAALFGKLGRPVPVAGVA